MIPAVPGLRDKIQQLFVLFLYPLPRTNIVDLASFDSLEPRFIVVRIVRWTRERRAYRAVLSQKRGKKLVTRIPTIRTPTPKVKGDGVVR